VPALPFVHDLLSWTKPKSGKASKPNMADGSSPTSVAIASELLNALRITRKVEHVGQTAGKKLEVAVEKHLAEVLPPEIAHSPLTVSRRPPITEFSQYEHLALLEELIQADSTRTLRASIGTDYVIEPDVTVGLERGWGESLYLHAAIPCKWTLRSDRAQNIRHEAVVLIRHRRGRLPHITPVTAEPLPTRIASLARGTAEVDTVYHVALDELRVACSKAGTKKQIEALDELTTHNRLRDLSELAPTLSI
jgi:hypothetical protein